jgi:hypothetical protein
MPHPGRSCQPECKYFEPCPIIPANIALAKPWYVAWQHEGIAVRYHHEYRGLGEDAKLQRKEFAS